MNPAHEPASGARTRRNVQVVIIGGGQAGLATGFYLRRAGLTPGQDFVILDAANRPGWMMPPWNDAELGYPPRDHVVDYLTRYEQRYDLNVTRSCTAHTVTPADDDPGGRLIVATDLGDFAARAVVSATGTWDRPFVPSYPGMRHFTGHQLHAANYREPGRFAGQRVVIVGGGNSAAQILAEISTVADTTWVTTRPPRFLPDDVDGRALFAAARARIQALQEGRDHAGVAGLGDIVMVEAVRAARDRGVLKAQPMFDRLTRDGVAWADGAHQNVDAVIWCTGFRPALRHLRHLDLRTDNGHPAVGGASGTRAISEPRLYLVGYGDWTGPASATLAGVGPSARATAHAITAKPVTAQPPSRPLEGA
ncbi:NAD(P)-binding domain-containing protein [Flexivirga caeni]|uniref:NAD(P)/FAD-dependent oxidoreductase n=1 Tax=Flexivirga caeni TaxID=2294115 RepID=A0A3M9MGU0_9MICO|nr:NAD(P)-binding domain-containing protein [Flexivirga caeni]RNI24741.1 NAD(P)/FAD-dependent oxidoreductase [Flexivirga caeni]